MIEYKPLSIRPDQYQKIKQKAEEKQKTIIEVIDDLLAEKEEPREQPTPILNKCIWNFYYWKARSKDKETGQVLEWSKIDECPILTVFPDILQLPAKQRVDALMKACNTCLIKEKALKQEQRRKERQKYKRQNDFGEPSQEPSWQNFPSSGYNFFQDRGK